jgi:imidazolonepropionase
MTIQTDLIIHNARQLITCASPKGPRRGSDMADVGIIQNGAVAITGGNIVAVGTTSDVITAYSAPERIDASGRVVCPGFVDPHTHIVYTGDRVVEFEMRIKGTTYMEIMQAGGGIVGTVKAIHAAPVEQLVAEAYARLDRMLALGTTTVEVKTGYGLDVDSETKLLHTIAALAEAHVTDLVPTFLGAHAIPPEYKNRPDDYIALVIDEMLPAAADWYRGTHFAENNIPFFVDVFCEDGVFDVEQSRRVLAAGQKYGLAVKAHVDEFKSLGGVTMAIELGAVSVDHLDATGAGEIATLAGSQTIGVVLPAVNFNLGSLHFADARAMIDAGAALALATDINPGSAPCYSMPLVMAIACRYQHLLPAEALIASTINAAHAIGLGDRVGSIEPGKQADLLVIDAPDYRHIAYEFGGNRVTQVFKRGKLMQ